MIHGGSNMFALFWLRFSARNIPYHLNEGKQIIT